MLSWILKPPEPEPPVLDRAYLERLIAHIGETDTVELLADGMLELADRMRRLNEHAAGARATALGEVLHDLAGASGHLGLTALALNAAEAQRVLRADPPADLARLIAPIQALEAPSLDALDAFCADRSAGPDAGSQAAVSSRDGPGSA